jgi:hypothetical protein
MSTTGLWIVTGIEGLLILGMGVFTYFGLGGITRIVTKTGAELTAQVTSVTTKLPMMIEEAIKKGGADMANSATNMATNQVSNLEGAATSQLNNATGAVNSQLNNAAGAVGVPAEAPVQTTTQAQAGGGKQTKGNKPQKIRKPRTKKNIKKIGNQMYMNFSL